MAGNSNRKGATRKGASRKGPSVGSGGQRRQGLEPKKPTPKASERTGHPAARRAKAAGKRVAKASATSRAGGPGPRPGSRTGGRARKDATEVVYGRNSVVEAIRAGVPAATLYVQLPIDTDDRVREAIALSVETKLPLLEVPRSQLDDMSSRGAHQGVLLTVPAYEYADPSDLLDAAASADEYLLAIALDGVTDPRNLGAVIRSAAAFGAHGVIVPERRAAGVTASAWKTSAGAAARLPVARVTNMTRALKELAASGAMVVGLAGDGDPIDDIDSELLAGPVVLVIGSEGKGLSRLVRDTCDVVVSIPIGDRAESLNASVAAGVALYATSAARRASH